MRRRISELATEAGSQITGASVAIAASSAPWPIAGYAGVAVGACLATGLQEFVNRRLGTRQTDRVGAVAYWAVDEIGSRIKAGEVPRSDGFFHEDFTDRSPADELLEATLQAASDAHEERKLRFLAHLMAEATFNEALTRESANWLCRTAGELSFTQYMILAAAGLEEKNPLPDAVDGTERTPTWITFSEELGNLGWGQREMISGQRDPGASRIDLNFQHSRQRLTASGRLFHTAMGLDGISKADLEDLIESLSC